MTYHILAVELDARMDRATRPGHPLAARAGFVVPGLVRVAKLRHALLASSLGHVWAHSKPATPHLLAARGESIMGVEPRGIAVQEVAEM